MIHMDENKKNLLKRDVRISEITETRLKETYQKIRQENMEKTRKAKYHYRKAAAAAAAIAIAVTATGGTAAAAYISSHTDFLQGMFGNATKESTQAKQVPADPDKKDGIMTDIPGKEYVSVDEEKADALIGDKISDEKLVTQIGDHTLTVENYVTDGNVSLMYFTLEREGGVTALYSDEELNHAKGAVFTEDADFDFCVTEAGGGWAAENMYVDLEKSTEDKLYVYDYMVWTSEQEGSMEPQLEINRYPMTWKEAEAEARGDEEKLQEIMGNGETETLPISSGEKIELQSLEQDGNWICSFSPISISVNMLLEAESEAEASDPYCIRHVELKYKDGSSYVVNDRDEMDNTGYACGVGTEYRAAFNRIVDTEQISEIIINDHTYKVGS